MEAHMMAALIGWTGAAIYPFRLTGKGSSESDSDSEPASASAFTSASASTSDLEPSVRS